jgi:hypothetical protein
VLVVVRTLSLRAVPDTPLAPLIDGILDQMDKEVSVVTRYRRPSGEIVSLDAASFCRQSVFDVYLGLTAAGYDLANASRAGEILRAISAEEWPSATLDYFRQARIADGRVNPYWPRGSILASISCLMDDRHIGADLASIQSYLETLSNVSPSERDQETAAWAMALPEQKRLLRSSRGYSAVWSEYIKAVEREIEVRDYDYRQRAEYAESVLTSLLCSRPLSVGTILNPLQADPLVDVLRTGDSLYVITSHLRPEAYVHELVHVYLDALLRQWAPIISARKDLLNAVYEPMLHFSYAWDRSASSWMNVFSETLVRCLTVWALSGGNRESWEQQVGAMVCDGFLYAPFVSEAIASAKQPLTEQWLIDCLDACEAADINVGAV